MNSEEAKLFLHACRLNGEDANAPRMAEALEQTRRDPELFAWYNDQRALDAAISQKLQQIRVPPDLADKILSKRMALSQRPTRRYWMPLALAASVVLLLSLGLLTFGRFKSPPTEFAAMRADMAGFLAEFPRLDLATDQWPEIVRWLARNPALTSVEIPPSLKQFPGLGCREVRWRGKRLMLVCFAAQGEIVHLFIIPKSELRDGTFPPAPVYARVNSWSTASWSQGDVVFLTLTKRDEKFLNNLLAGSNRI
jgi:Protein of unknown function (DUF3379)